MKYIKKGEEDKEGRREGEKGGGEVKEEEDK